jgi:acetyl esterase
MDGACRRWRDLLDLEVVSVNYRLAPEHPYPAALEDVYNVLQALWRERPQPLAIAGDSAGGNLAAAVAILCRDRQGPPLCHQTLIYPPLARNFHRPSWQQYGIGYGLRAEEMVWCWQHYLQGGAAPYAEPLQIADLSDLPPAHLVLAECDILRDEGLAYGAALARAGVPVKAEVFTGMTHGFIGLPELPHLGESAIGAIGQQLRIHLRGMAE